MQCMDVLGFYAIGLPGKWLVEASIIVSQLGTCDVYTMWPLH